MRINDLPEAWKEKKAAASSHTDRHCIILHDVVFKHHYDIPA